jgi:fatty-acyl-CoA synthase
MAFQTLSALQADTFSLNVGTLLDTGMRSAGRNPIVYGDNVRMTYAEFKDRIHRLADALTRHGVRAGTKVAIMEWDSHRYLEAFFAAPMLGATLVTINIRLSPAQMAFAFEHSESSVIIVAQDLAYLIAHFDPSRLSECKIIVTDAPSRDSLAADDWEDYETLLAASDPEFVFPTVSEDAIATTFYTTGTTGAPKGVFFTHRQLVLHSLAVATALGCSDSPQHLGRADVYMPITPLFHVHAWGMPYIATMLGLKQVYPGRYDANALVALKQREGVTFSHCVPTILEMILSAASAQGVGLHGWKIMIGGSVMPRTLAQAAMERGLEVFSAYGMSETCPVLTIVRTDPNEVDPIGARCSAGSPIPLVEVKIEAHQASSATGASTSMANEVIGEIVVRSPWLTAGYLKNREASLELWRGGYLHTQDVGAIDHVGRLRVRDRIKDVIKTGGEWVSSLALEEIIRNTASVRECAVVAVPDAKWGERPVAFLAPAASVSTADIESCVLGALTAAVSAGKLAKYAVPDRIVFVEELPKTSVGKIDKKALRHRITQET